MNMPPEDIVVTDIAGNQARLCSFTDIHDAALSREGFFRHGNDLTRPITDVEDRIKLVRFLIEIDAVFSSGKDWSPEEIVETYKEQGLIDGGYRVISWTAPDRYVVTDQ